MFEPNEEEARRAEALNMAIMSTASNDTFQGHDTGTKVLLARAEKFEAYLKEGIPEQAESTGGNHDHGPQSAFGQYQRGGLDASST